MLALEFIQDVSFWVTELHSSRLCWTPGGNVNAACSACVFCSPGVCVLYWCQEPCFDHVRNFKQQLFWTQMQRNSSLPWKSYLKRIMCVCGKWGALEYNIIIPAKLVSRFIDLLHKGPSKIKQTWRTATPVPWMLSVIHWPCPTRLFSSSCCLIEMQRRFRALVLEV